MIEIAMVFGVMALQTPQAGEVLQTVPVPPFRLSDHTAVVRYDCTLVDEGRETSRFVFEKRGKMQIFSPYDARQKASTEVNIPKPAYRVSEQSDPRFGAMESLGPGEREFIGPTSVLALDGKDDFAAIFSFGRPHANRARYNAYPLVLYLPDDADRNRAQTLSGVCIAERLKDETP